MTEIYNAQGESRGAILSNKTLNEDLEVMRTLYSAKIN